MLVLLMFCPYFWLYFRPLQEAVDKFSAGFLQLGNSSTATRTSDPAGECRPEMSQFFISYQLFYITIESYLLSFILCFNFISCSRAQVLGSAVVPGSRISHSRHIEASFSSIFMIPLCFVWQHCQIEECDDLQAEFDDCDSLFFFIFHTPVGIYQLHRYLFEVLDIFIYLFVFYFILFCPKSIHLLAVEVVSFLFH